jgi:hypothetical protein
VIVVLFICKSIWCFKVPWWMWIVASCDSVFSVVQRAKP